MRYFTTTFFLLFIVGSVLFLLPSPTNAQHAPWQTILPLSQDSMEYNFVDVSFSDPQNGTALGWALDLRNPFGGYQTVLKRTRNGGRTWTGQRSPVNGGVTIKEAKFNKIFSVDSLHVVAMGDSGKIIATSDAGEHWRQVDSTRIWRYMDISFSDKLHGVACTDYGHIITTSDAGQTWQIDPKKFVYAEGLRSVCAISPNSFYGLSYFYNMMLRTFDNGHTWDTTLLISDDFAGSSGKQLYKIYFIGSNVGFIVGGDKVGGWNGFIARTSNGGTSWDTVYDHSFDNEPIRAVAFADNMHGVAATGSGVRVTSDGGLTWKLDSITTTTQPFGDGVAYPSLNTMFVCSSQGFSGSIVGFLPSNDVAIGQSLSQSINLYPNPATSEIHLQLPASAHGYTIEISDLLGRVVRRLSNVHDRISITRESLSSGTYFIRGYSVAGEAFTSSVVLN
jgi:photosystem II stability/assembly factor-like uncharacterized protein